MDLLRFDPNNLITRKTKMSACPYLAFLVKFDAFKADLFSRFVVFWSWLMTVAVPKTLEFLNQFDAQTYLLVLILFMLYFGLRGLKNDATRSMKQSKKPKSNDPKNPRPILKKRRVSFSTAKPDVKPSDPCRPKSEMTVMTCGQNCSQENNKNCVKIKEGTRGGAYYACDGFMKIRSPDGQFFSLKKGNITCGRGDGDDPSEYDVRICVSGKDTAAISRYHCKLYWDYGVYYLKSTAQNAFSVRYSGSSKLISVKPDTRVQVKNGMRIYLSPDFTLDVYF